MRLLIAFAAALLLASCTNIPKDFKFDEKKQTGLVIGSSTYNSSPGLYRIVVDRRGSYRHPLEGWFLEVGAGMWYPGAPIYDEALKSRGGTFAVELPAGEYEIAYWYVARGGHKTVSGRIGLPFTVEPGKVTYLGTFDWSTHWENISLRNASERDVPLLQERYPGLKTLPVVMGFPPNARYEKLGGSYR